MVLVVVVRAFLESKDKYDSQDCDEGYARNDCNLNFLVSALFELIFQPYHAALCYVVLAGWHVVCQIVIVS